MSTYKVALFDVDGVLICQPKLFSQQYCERFGVDPALQEQFYATKEFKETSVGRFDLKDAIIQHRNLWQWCGDPEDLMRMWFEGENEPNEALLTTIKQLRCASTRIYLATQQEKYRKAYLQEHVFNDHVDGIFSTCDIGYNKHDVEYWHFVLDQLKANDPTVLPAEIVYFDDRQNLVDLARSFGIQAYVFVNAEQVQCIVGT